MPVEIFATAFIELPALERARLLNAASGTCAAGFKSVAPARRPTFDNAFFYLN
jgi:hypothetical protein